MAEPPAPSEKKTIAIRVSSELRGRLDTVLQIKGISVNDAGTAALEAWVEQQLSDPGLRAKALASLEDEERELKARREVLQGLMSSGDTATSKPSVRRADKP